MSIPAVTLQRLQQRAAQAEQILTQLRAQLNTLKKTAAVSLCRSEESKLQSENAGLRQEIVILKEKLVTTEVRNGLKQVPLPASGLATNGLLVESARQMTTDSSDKKAAPPKPAEQEPKQQQQKKKEKKEKKEPKPAPEPVAASPIDVSRLDMRIGHIVEAKKHPDADGLYVETVDLGEEGRGPRTIVSGLVKHVPLEEMQNRYAIFLVNLKPAKMRGILSEGMIMCASTPEKVEIINPPPGVRPGDRINVDGYAGSPDSLLNPKKKIWEQIQPDLRVNEDGAATYKGALWRVEGADGQSCMVPTMRGTNIK